MAVPSLGIVSASDAQSIPTSARQIPNEMERHLQAIVTVLSLVNPLICGVMELPAKH